MRISTGIRPHIVLHCLDGPRSMIHNPSRTYRLSIRPSIHPYIRTPYPMPSHPNPKRTSIHILSSLGHERPRASIHPSIHPSIAFLPSNPIDSIPSHRLYHPIGFIPSRPILIPSIDRTRGFVLLGFNRLSYIVIDAVSFALGVYIAWHGVALLCLSRWSRPGSWVLAVCRSRKVKRW
ncbi:hypothetical protein BDN70DRAFT_708763 [Pholiota conissans]|uniref:CHASE domain-containing protein n=1 Tax=Pholiota conissans TaxID=109636 RepID=A0A9P5Z1R8_9AGAR|nr:hypothetical protein BDN70DRAFT_708763 [Pholiota conissans]